MQRLLLALLLAVPAFAGCVGDPDATSPPATHGGASTTGAPPSNVPVGGDDAAAPDEDEDDASAKATGPAWSFVDTEGAMHSRDAAAGKPSVLFFMATWCTTCKTKTGMLAQIEKDYAAKGLRVFSVSQDPTETQDDLRAWKAQYAQPWPHGPDPDRGVQRAFGVSAQSSFVVLDASGEVVKKWGYPGADEAGLRAAIDDAFARGA